MNLLKCFRLLPQGNHLDGLHYSNATDDQNVRLQYERFLRFTGVTGSNSFTNGVTYRDFATKGGFFIQPFDFTTGLTASCRQVIPRTRTGRLRLEVFFTYPLMEDITCIIFSEHNAVLSFSGTPIQASVNYDTGAL